MSKIKIVVCDSPFPSLDPAKEALARLDPIVVQAKSASAEDILAEAKDADGILVTYAKLPGDLLRQCKKLKVIGRFGLGVDNIDIPAAKELGIVVTYVPDYCLHEVSDHAMALLLSIARKIPLANTSVQSGEWKMPVVVPLRRFNTQTLGLIGFGGIPRSLAPKAQSFGFKVIASDPFLPKEMFDAAKVESVTLDELYARSDLISVHAPLMPQTRGLVNDDAFAKMKQGVMIVNTARGPLIDEDALVRALDSGKVAAAGLDVVTTEPLPKDSKLLGRGNVVITPHTGFYSVEALLELETKCAKDVASVLSGEKPVYPVKM
ncbi:MAG: C-terminal binding protein [Rhodoplanes sp.]|uniref:C-terminal binding protein n=1 Tax=Rhodoplanes sp. TaxID=1968906 RepID=UPI0018171F2C|nr:C-terminal binding protein [Rhodoplanes sp.]NVO14945.1 C-terminal binding protein [Rhodoplanes sp.]